MKPKEPHDFRIFSGFQELAKLADNLLGIVSVMTRNTPLSNEEKEYLNNWIIRYENKDSKTKTAYKEIFTFTRNLLRDGIITDEEIQELSWLNEQFQGSGSYALAATTDMRILHGMLQGALADGEISTDEAEYISDWIQEHTGLKGTWPYDEIETLLVHVLKDKIITDAENELLSSMFTNFIKDDEHAVIQNPLLFTETMVTTVCATDPQIEFTPDKLFCFTGISIKGTRAEFAEVVEKRGALFTDAVTKNLDYLIIGADGNPCWTFSCYGRKIEKAISYRKKGSQLQIIHEADFWDALVQ
jgi:hypothetical protein